MRHSFQRRVQKNGCAFENIDFLEARSKVNKTVSLPVIFVNPKVVVYEVSSAQVFHKLLVVSDNYKLKVPLLLTGSDDSEKNTKNGNYDDYDNDTSSIRSIPRAPRTAVHI